MPGFCLCKLKLSIASASKRHYEDKKQQANCQVTARHLRKIFEGPSACKGDTVMFLRTVIPSSFSKVISACPFWSL